MAALAPMLLSTIIDPASCAVLTTSATVGSDSTYNPEGFRQGGVAAWVNRAGGIALGYPRYTQLIRPPSRESRVFKVSAKFFYPILETIDPAVGIFGPKLAYDCQAHMDFLIPERATAADKAAFLSLVRSLFMLSIVASDGNPSSTVASPLIPAITLQEDVY